MAIIELEEYGPDFNSDPYPFYAKLREAGPVHEVRDDTGQRFWLVVGYEEGRAALADPRLSKSPMAGGLPEEAMGPHVLTSDPPDHTRLRKLVSREFTGRRVESLRPRVQQITDGLLDALPASGRADLVDVLAFPLPITVICELLGVPHEDRDTFRAWTNGFVAPSHPGDAEKAAGELTAYLDHLIQDKRAAHPGDDLLSALLRTNAQDDDRLSADELRAMAFVLLVAGHETTVNLISNGVRALLDHPDQLAALRADLSLLDGAIEEMLRYDGPVETSTRRFALEPLAYGDVVVPPGDMVLVALASIDRDPFRFTAPDTFDIRRSRTPGRGGGHLAFGHGIHFCLGAPLARLEGRIAVRSLLERCPDLSLDPAAGPYDWLPGRLIRGTRRLPVRW